MTSYSELDGIPATGDKNLLTNILRDQWGFTGFVVSDWPSVMEMLPHGFAGDAKDAAKRAANAGLDFEMYSTALQDNLPQLIADKEVEQTRIDSAERRMIRAKIAMGLFDNPYAEGEEEFLKQEYLETAKQAAMQSFVLLKNDDKVLPLNKNQKIAVIGPLAEVPYQQMGTWVCEGEAKDSRTLLPALKDYLGAASNNVKYAAGLPYSRSMDKAGFEQAIQAASGSDVILFFGGEEAVLTGEGHSRPNTLGSLVDKVDSMMMAWHPGTMAGPALVDVLYGEVSPSGKLPIAWPLASGQIPMYYNHKATGRPPNDDNYTRIDKINPHLTWQHEPGNSSNYLDYGHSPQFPFGFGLSYSAFEYSDLSLNNSQVAMGDKVKLSIQIKNTGDVEATEIVQLYVRDLVADVTRPVKELKAFERVTLAADQKKTVDFELSTNSLYFHNRDMVQVVEPGRFKLWIARDSADEAHETSFELVE